MGSTTRNRWRRGASAWALGAVALLGLGCAASASAPRPPQEQGPASARSDAAQRQHVAVTVYNSNFALVREERELELGIGRVALAYADVSAHIQPASVHIRSLAAPDALVVLEQNYRYDLLSPENLLEKYVGRQLKVARYNRELGTDEIVDAELLSTQNGPVWRVAGEIVTGAYDRFIFPELPQNLLSKPTLVWLLDSTRAHQKVEVTYLTENLSWRADYVLVLNADEKQADLSAWVTLDNQSGTAFTGAELRLVAGDVQRLAPSPPPMPEMSADAAGASPAPPPAFTREALFEYHLYALSRPTDLLDKEQKQINLLDAPGMTLTKKLVLRGAEYGYRARATAAIENQKVSVALRIDNTEAHGLGMPLPQGVWRVYKADAAGAQQFLGEDALDHTAAGEQIEIELGQAFDVVADRRQLGWRSLSSCSSESDWEVELRNHKSTPVQVEVEESATGDSSIVESSHPSQKRDAHAFSFALDVPAQAATKLTYRVRVRWC